MDKDTIFKLLISGLVVFAIAMLILVIVVINTFNNKPGIINDYKFELNSENKFKIITDAAIMTTKNEGSSYTNAFYQFDLENNVIGRVIENHPSKYSSDQTVKIDEVNKKVDNGLKTEAKELLDYIMNNNDKNTEAGNRYYTLEGYNLKKEIYDTDTINKIKALFIKIDDYKE